MCDNLQLCNHHCSVRARLLPVVRCVLYHICNKGCRGQIVKVETNVYYYYNCFCTLWFIVENSFLPVWVGSC